MNRKNPPRQAENLSGLERKAVAASETECISYLFFRSTGITPF
jgi:hypothetical protein